MIKKSICCDNEKSFAPATMNRASDFHNLLYLFGSLAKSLISVLKSLIFPSGINIMYCHLYLCRTFYFGYANINFNSNKDRSHRNLVNLCNQFLQHISLGG